MSYIMAQTNYINCYHVIKNHRNGQLFVSHTCKLAIKSVEANSILP